MKLLYLALVFLCASEARLFSAEQLQRVDNLFFKSDLVFDGDAVKITQNVLGTKSVEDYDVIYVKPKRIFKASFRVEEDSLIPVVVRARVTKGMHALDTGGPWGTRIDLPSEVASNGDIKYANLPITGLFFLKIINTRHDDIYTGSATWTKSASQDPNFVALRDQVQKLAKLSEKSNSGLCKSVLWILAVAGAGGICFLFWRSGKFPSFPIS